MDSDSTSMGLWDLGANLAGPAVPIPHVLV